MVYALLRIVWRSQEFFFIIFFSSSWSMPTNSFVELKLGSGLPRRSCFEASFEASLRHLTIQRIVVELKIRRYIQRTLPYFTPLTRFPPALTGPPQFAASMGLCGPPRKPNLNIEQRTNHFKVKKLVIRTSFHFNFQVSLNWSIWKNFYRRRGISRGNTAKRVNTPHDIAKHMSRTP